MSAAAGAHDLILAEVDGKCQFAVNSGKQEMARVSTF